jgi:hypothetical protein
MTEWANALGLTVLLGSGCRKSHVRSQIGARNFQNLVMIILVIHIYMYYFLKNILIFLTLKLYSIILKLFFISEEYESFCDVASVVQGKY